GGSLSNYQNGSLHLVQTERTCFARRRYILVEVKLVYISQLEVVVFRALDEGYPQLYVYNMCARLYFLRLTK
ncbi:hypothetical protein, partial [Pseudoalteromonas luteoviolacea]|uniref:hypothetical protein n=1 Tax=Pseudoalteromonas luteoviolacea TaxID=43657 RepID=UPI000A78DDFD